MTQAPKDASEAPRKRPWQIMLTGPCLGAIDAATRPDDPRWSAHGNAYANIEEAAVRGELTPDAAIVAYRRLAKS
jgi:hypothetical protein